jgi:hypothetical protein
VVLILVLLFLVLRRLNLVLDHHQNALPPSHLYHLPHHLPKLDTIFAPSFGSALAAYLLCGQRAAVVLEKARFVCLIFTCSSDLGDRS